MFGATVNIAAISVLYVWQPNQDETWVFFAVAAMWGVADAIWQTQINGKIACIVREVDNLPCSFSPLAAVYTCDFAYELPYDSVCNFLHRVGSK
jgi:hypothetical protein